MATIYCLFATPNEYHATEELIGWWSRKPTAETIMKVIKTYDPMAEMKYVEEVANLHCRRVSECAIKHGGIDFALSEEEESEY